MIDKPKNELLEDVGGQEKVDELDSIWLDVVAQQNFASDICVRVAFKKKAMQDGFTIKQINAFLALGDLG